MDHDPKALEVLTPARLAALAAAAWGAGPCAACEPLVCPGWETVPAGFDAQTLRPLGTLRQPAQGAADETPTLAEYHPNGTRLWSPQAPIAPAWHPYNLCDVMACVGCGRAFLRYTEYGGYYVDERVRELDPRLVAAEAPPPPRD